jgi:cysteine synthase/rhodanese-related sulfurtransferase
MGIKNKELFTGKDAIREYLDLDNHPYIPCVELPASLNPFESEKVKIFAKLMNVNPLENVKAIPAYRMVKKAYENGDLEGVHTLVENSSGNTVFSLAVIGRLFGVPNTIALVSNEVLEGKMQLLRLFNTEIEVIDEPICPDPRDKESGIYKAKRMGKKVGFFNPGQYDNIENPKAHEVITGKQIWEQMDGKITVFCAGLGTTGTMVGASLFLKNKNKNIATVGVVRTPNNPVPGVRTKNLLNMSAFEWEKHTDHVEEIGTTQSFEKSLEMIRSGLFVGPSSGFALAGLIKFIEKRKNEGTLDRLRNNNSEIICVFVCCDSPLPYADEYFQYLDESHFPKIKNKNLLMYTKEDKTDNKPKRFNEDGFVIKPLTAFNEMFSESAEEISHKLKTNHKVELKKNIVILDLRKKSDFDHFHLPESKNVDISHSLKDIKKLSNTMKNKKVFVICNLGNSSYLLAKALREQNIDAYSISGGITEWSNLNLPRWKPLICK